MKTKKHTTRLFLAVLLLSAVHYSSPAQKLEGSFNIFAVDTVPKFTALLPAGKLYTFLCEGTYSFWRNALNDSVGLVDAAYYRVIPPGEFAVAGMPTSSTNGFLINGQAIAGMLRPAGLSPTYAYNVPFTGLGAPVNLFIEDTPPFSVDRHADNTGMLRISIFNVSPEMAHHPDAIDFGEVELGSYRDTIVTVKNIGYGPLTLTGVNIGGTDSGHYSLRSPASVVLQSGDSVQLIIRFQPGNILQKNAVLLIPTDDVDAPLIQIPMTGVGVTTLTAGFLNTYRAQPDDQITIPVTLFTNIEGSDVTSYRCNILYNPRVLFPLSVRQDQSLSNAFGVTATIDAPGIIHVSATGATPLTGTGNLLFLDFIVVFTDSTGSDLALDSLLFNAGNPRAKIVEGFCAIDSACNHYLKRIVPAGGAQLLQNHPNPFNPETVIEYILPRDEFIRLDVYGSAGKNISTLQCGIQTKGLHRVSFQGSGLSAGTYYYRLQFPDGELIRDMTLMK